MEHFSNALSDGSRFVITPHLAKIEHQQEVFELATLGQTGYALSDSPGFGLSTEELSELSRMLAITDQFWDLIKKKQEYQDNPFKYPSGKRLVEIGDEICAAPRLKAAYEGVPLDDVLP